MSAWITWKIAAKPLAVEPPLTLRSSTTADEPSNPAVFLFQKWPTEHQTKHADRANEPKDHFALAVTPKHHRSPGPSILQ